MVKVLFMKQVPAVLAALWLLYRRRFIVDRIIWILTQKIFVLIGNRYPRLSFLKTVAAA